MSSDIVRRLRRLLGAQGLRDAGVDDESVEDLVLPAWLEALAAAATAMPLPEVPPVVRQDLLRLFEVAQEVEPEVAVLVRDTRTSGRLVGVRGTADSEGWSLTYTSAVVDVVLDVWPNDGGTVDVMGQVMAHREIGKAYRARVEGPTTASVSGDRLGRFQLHELSSGRYELEIGNGEITLTLTADLTGATA